MGKAEQNRLHKQQQILQAAKEIFLEAGFVVAKMDDIAAKAQVTKQTVYRYFNSKESLFEAVLAAMGEQSERDMHTWLKLEDNREALEGFALAFIDWHLSEQHLATCRLLIAESYQAPQISQLFRNLGPDETDRKLEAFFTQRLGLVEPQAAIDRWTAMLLEPTLRALMGMGLASAAERKLCARQATELLLVGLERGVFDS